MATRIPIHEKRYTVKQIADWYEVGISTVYRWIRNGLPSEGPPHRITKESVLRYLGSYDDPQAVTARVSGTMHEHAMRLWEQQLKSTGRNRTHARAS